MVRIDHIGGVRVCFSAFLLFFFMLLLMLLSLLL